MPIAATVGRLAPSPTGGLHLGHARTFFLAWLSARQDSGRLILRVEDLDASRVRAEALTSHPHRPQMARARLGRRPRPRRPLRPLPPDPNDSNLYQDALHRLQAANLVYPCTCTRADIARAASAPHAEDEGPTYPGTCAIKPAERVIHNPASPPFAWRFRVPDRPIAWLDLVAGPIDLDPSRHGGDFVLGRTDAGPSYQLAVVVDDALMGVNQVIRGDDLLSSTPRQLLALRGPRLACPRVLATCPWPLGPTAAGSPSATSPSNWPPSAKKVSTPAA